MKTIFLPLAVLSTLLLSGTLLLGLGIENAADAKLSHQVDYHLWTSIGGMLFATLVHGLVMTYFIGTGRWFEETARGRARPTRGRQATWRTHLRGFRSRDMR